MKRPKPVAEPAELCKDGTMQHYWIIALPDGPTSWGKCRRCKARREFRNSLNWEPELQKDGHKKMRQMILKS